MRIYLIENYSRNGVNRLTPINLSIEDTLIKYAGKVTIAIHLDIDDYIKEVVITCFKDRKFESELLAQSFFNILKLPI